MLQSVKERAKQCLTPASLIRLAVLVVFIVAVILVFVLLPIEDLISSFITDIQNLGAFGALIFILAYASCNILFIPGTLLNLASGYVFGVPLGTFIVWCGASLGSSCCFFLGKFLFKYWADWFQSKFKMAGVLNRAISKNAFKILLLLRLSPVMPYMVLNYSLSIVEGLPFWKFLVTNMIGMLPGVLLYVYLGSIAQDVTSLINGTATNSSLHDALFIGGLVFTLISVITISFVATREIKKEMKEPTNPSAEVQIDEGFKKLEEGEGEGGEGPKEMVPLETISISPSTESLSSQV